MIILTNKKNRFDEEVKNCKFPLQEVGCTLCYKIHRITPSLLHKNVVIKIKSLTVNIFSSLFFIFVHHGICIRIQTVDLSYKRKR